MKKVSIFLAAVILIAGTAIVYAQTTPSATTPAAGTHDRQMGKWLQRAPELSSELNLTEDQRTQITAILVERQKALKALRDDTTLTKEQLKTKGTEIMQASQKQIDAILTQEQQTTLKALREKMREQMKERMKKRGSKGKPGTTAK